MTWTTALLGDVATLDLGKMLDQHKNKGEMRPYLANINVRWGSFDLNGLREMRFESHELDRFSLKRGDIVMCEGGEPGRCAIWKDDAEGMMFQKALHRIRPGGLLDSSFLFYAFLHFGKSGGFSQYFTGATIKHLPREQLAKVEVRFPDIGSQRQIAEVLERYDDLIENNRRRIALLEESARLLYREWFVHLRFPGHDARAGAGVVSEGWRDGYAADFVLVLSGGTPDTKNDRFWGGDIPFFTPKDCKGSVFVQATEKSLTEDGLVACNSPLFPKMTIFITARGTVGKLALAQQPMAMNQSCYALAPKSGVNNLFLFLALEDRIAHLKTMASGGVFDAIVVDTFKKLPFLCPPAKLMDDFGSTVLPVFDQIENLHVQNARLTEAREALLPKLMSGEIAV